MKSYPFAFAEVSVTNKGVSISPDVPIFIIERMCHNHWKVPRKHYALFIGQNRDSKEVGICLQKIGTNVFARCDGTMLGFGKGQAFTKVDITSGSEVCHVLTDIPLLDLLQMRQKFRDNAISVPVSDSWNLLRSFPETLWDVTDRTFLRTRNWRWYQNPLAQVCWFRHRDGLGDIIVMCHDEQGNRAVKAQLYAFDPNQHHKLAELILDSRGYEPLRVRQLLLEYPRAREFSDTVTQVFFGRLVQTRAYLESGVMDKEFPGPTIPTYELRLGEGPINGVAAYPNPVDDRNFRQLPEAGEHLQWPDPT